MGVSGRGEDCGGGEEKDTMGGKESKGKCTVAVMLVKSCHLRIYVIQVCSPCLFLSLSHDIVCFFFPISH